MSEKTVQASYTGSGPNIQKEVPVSEVEELSDNWEVVGEWDGGDSDSIVEELGEGEEVSGFAKKAEEKGITELSVNLNNVSDAWFTEEEIRKLKRQEEEENRSSTRDEIKEEIESQTGESAENAYRQARKNERKGTEESRQKHHVADSMEKRARSSAAGNAYREIAQEIREEAEEVESDSTHEEFEESEPTEEEIEGIAEAEEAAAEAFDDRARSSEGSNVWGEIADEIRENKTKNQEEELSEEDNLAVEQQTQVLKSEGVGTVVTTSDTLREELHLLSQETDTATIISESEEKIIGEVDLDEFEAYLNN